MDGKLLRGQSNENKYEKEIIFMDRSYKQSSSGHCASTSYIFNIYHCHKRKLLEYVCG